MDMIKWREEAAKKLPGIELGDMVFSYKGTNIEVKFKPVHFQSNIYIGRGHNIFADVDEFVDRVKKEFISIAKYRIEYLEAEAESLKRFIENYENS